MRPTLPPPPNRRSLSDLEMTATCALAVSSAADHGPPYWNGTSNIGKKSCVVSSEGASNAAVPVPVGRILSGLLVITAWRSARPDFHRSTAEV